MADLDPEIAAAVDPLVDDYRSTCLWFLRPDYYPRTAEEIARVLRWIRGHGDVEAFRRAGEMERWLSHRSNETSAGS